MERISIVVLLFVRFACLLAWGFAIWIVCKTTVKFLRRFLVFICILDKLIHCIQMIDSKLLFFSSSSNSVWTCFLGCCLWCIIELWFTLAFIVHNIIKVWAHCWCHLKWIILVCLILLIFFVVFVLLIWVKHWHWFRSKFLRIHWEHLHWLILL